MNREIVSHFEKTWKEYDGWYDTHQALYRTEIAAVRKAAPSGAGLEIGVGTGRFAVPLGARFGLDPAAEMIALAKKRGISVVQGVGERLPFKEESFDFVQIIFVIECVNELSCFLKEAARTLKKGGALILGFINKDSAWGRYYAQDPSHRAHFHPPSREAILEISKRPAWSFRKPSRPCFSLPRTSSSRRNRGAGSEKADSLS